MPKLQVVQKPITQGEAIDTIDTGVAQGVTQNELYWQATNSVLTKNNFESAFEQRAKDASIGAPNFTPDLLNDFDKNTETVLNQAPSETTRQGLKEELGAYRGTLANRALGFEAQANVQRQGEEAKELLNRSIDRVMASPDLLEDSFGDMDNIGKLLPKEMKESFEKDYTTRLSRSAIEALMKNDVDAAEKMLNKGVAAKTLPEGEKENLRVKIQIERNKQIEATKQLTANISSSSETIKRKIAAGTNISDEEFDVLDGLVAQTEDDETKQNFEQLKLSGQKSQILRSMPIDEAIEFAEKNKDAEMIEIANTLKQKSQESPLVFEADNGNLEIEPVDLENVDTLSNRLFQAEYAASKNSARIQLLTDEEITQFNASMDKMSPQQLLDVTSRLEEGFQTRSLNALEDISKQNPARGHAMGLAIAVPVEGKLNAKTILEGQEMLRTNPALKDQIFRDNRSKNKFSKIAGRAFQGNDLITKSINSSANAFYVKKAVEFGITDFDEALYEEAVRKAAGGTSDIRTGIQKINGLETALPPAVPDDDFEMFVNLLPEEIQGYGTFHNLGGNKYSIRINNREVTQVNITPETVQLARENLETQEQFQAGDIPPELLTEE